MTSSVVLGGVCDVGCPLSFKPQNNKPMADAKRIRTTDSDAAAAAAAAPAPAAADGAALPPTKTVVLSHGVTAYRFDRQYDKVRC